MLFGLAWAAITWTPTCSAPDERTAWIVLGAPAPIAPSDYGCPGLFLGDVPCDRIAGLATLRRVDRTPTLRYMPAGETGAILEFLDRAQGGVPFPSPPDAATDTALVDAWLAQRTRASAATAGITLQVWTCPDAPTLVPEAPGLSTLNRTARVVLR